MRTSVKISPFIISSDIINYARLNNRLNDSALMKLKIEWQPDLLYHFSIHSPSMHACLSLESVSL